MAYLSGPIAALIAFAVSIYAAQTAAPEMCGTVESNEINSTCVHKGYQMYDWETEICCNGTVHPWNDLTFCCGTELFDITSEVCCDEQVYAAVPGQLLGCCYSWEHDVSLPYDLDTELCCQGVVFVLPSEEEEEGWEGEEELNSEQGDGLNPGRNLTSRRRRFLGNSTGSPTNGWNGDDSESGSSESSEEEEEATATPAETPYDCCVNQIYNRDTHVCCNDRIQIKGGNMACCGHDFYDSHTQMCCEAIVEEGEWSRMEYAVLPLDHSRKECCGLAAIDYQTEICCDDGPVPLPEGVDADAAMSCCGSELVVDDDAQLCCGDSIHERYVESKAAMLDDYNATTGENATVVVFVERDCCLDQIYNPELQICCDDHLHARDPQNDVLECCFNTGTLYNVKTQLCCYPEVLVAPPTREDTDGSNEDKTYCCIPDHEYFYRK